MDRQAAYRLEQLVPLFNLTDSPDQLCNLVAEAGQILYGTLHDGTLVIDDDDAIKTLAVSICDSKQEHQRTLWDDGLQDFCYRLLFKLVSDSVSERQRTIYHLKWSDGAGSNIQQTDWESDFKHQGQRYALCCTQLAAMLTVDPGAELVEFLSVPVTPVVVAVDPVAEDGLDRSKCEFVWFGKRHEWLTETMMNALQVLFKAYQQQRTVLPDEMLNKIGNLPDGGFFKIFEVDRAGWEKVHPVRKIVGGRANSGWYLIEQNSFQT